MEYFPQQFFRRHLQIKFFLHHKKEEIKNVYDLYLCGSAKATLMERDLEQNNKKGWTSSSG